MGESPWEEWQGSKKTGSEEPVLLLISMLLKEVPGCLHSILIAPTPLGFDVLLTSCPPPVFSTSLLP